MKIIKLIFNYKLMYQKNQKNLRVRQSLNKKTNARFVWTHLKKYLSFIFAFIKRLGLFYIFIDQEKE